MFDFGVGYTEMFVIAVVAIIVIGPKDLPNVLRAFGKTVGKMRSMAREFQGHLDGAMKEAGLEDLKKEMQGLKNLANTDPMAPASKSVAPAKAADNSFNTYFGEPAKPASSPDAQ